MINSNLEKNLWIMNIVESFHMAIETDAGAFEGEYVFGAVSNLSVIDGTNLHNDSFKNNDGVMEMMLVRKPDTRSQAKEVLIPQSGA